MGNVSSSFAGGRYNETPLSILPHELLVAIISHLAVDTTRNLRHLSLVNRHLHDFTAEYLYNKYTSYESDASLFLRTIAQSPDLGRHVKSIDWGFEPNQRFCTPAKSRALSKADQEIITSRLRALKRPECDRLALLFPPFEGSDCGTVLYAFLMCTPHLEYLCLRHEWSYALRKTEYWYKPLAANPDLFTRLQYINLRGPLRIQNIILLLTLPSLRKLELQEVFPKKAQDIDEWTQPEKDVRHMLREGSSLEHLHIWNSMIEIESLRPLFEAFKSLRSFEYQHLQPTTRDLTPNEVIFPRLMNILRLQRTSLRHLHIRENRRMQAEDLENFLLNLGDFYELRSLTLGPLYLTSPVFLESHSPVWELARAFLRHFPLQVQHLEIVLETKSPGYRYIKPEVFLDIYSQFLSSLATEETRKRCPFLESITIRNWDPSFIADFAIEFRRLERVFREVGLRFVVEAVGEVKSRDLVAVEEVEDEWSSVQRIDLQDGRWVSSD